MYVELHNMYLEHVFFNFVVSSYLGAFNWLIGLTTTEGNFTRKMSSSHSSSRLFFVLHNLFSQWTWLFTALPTNLPLLVSHSIYLSKFWYEKLCLFYKKNGWHIEVKKLVIVSKDFLLCSCLHATFYQASQ
jgi:hypothetical protein